MLCHLSPKKHIYTKFTACLKSEDAVPGISNSCISVRSFSLVVSHNEEGQEWTNGQIIPALAESAMKPYVTAPIHGTHYLRHPWDACWWRRQRHRISHVYSTADVFPFCFSRGFSKSSVTSLAHCDLIKTQ